MSEENIETLKTIPNSFIYSVKEQHFPLVQG